LLVEVVVVQGLLAAAVQEDSVLLQVFL